MIFPILLFIADIFLWFLFTEAALLGDTLVSIAMFALAFSAFIWAVMEALELAGSFGSSDD